MRQETLSLWSYLKSVHDSGRFRNGRPDRPSINNEILMAQDFQDLTGQVIKKMMEVVNDVETQLLQVLIDNVPAEKRQEISTHNSMLNGPQIHAGAADAVADQSQVDDLLESLGF